MISAQRARSHAGHTSTLDTQYGPRLLLPAPTDQWLSHVVQLNRTAHASVPQSWQTGASFNLSASCRKVASRAEAYCAHSRVLNCQ